MKKARKWIAAVLAVAAMAIPLSGCTATEEESSSGSSTITSSTKAPESTSEKAAVRVAAIKGPTGVGMVNLMSRNEEKTTTNDYTFTIATSPDEVVGKFSTDDVDIASVPTNLAATLNQKTSGNVRMLAVNTKGVLYILENGSSISSVADLKGQTIYSTGEGSNPEYILRHILSKNGVDPDKDVTLKFVAENEELVTLLAAGEAKIAMVPEPNVTAVMAKSADIRIALSMTEAWDALDEGSSLLMGCVIARADYVEENPEAVKAFLSEYEASIQAVQADVDAAATLCEQYGIIPKAAVAKKAIPNCNLTYLAGKDMKDSISGYFQVLFDAEPKSIGGKLPDDSFYYLG